MKEVNREIPVRIQPPETYTKDNIAHWEPISKKLQMLAVNSPVAKKILDLARKCLDREIYKDGDTPEGNKRFRVGRYTVLYQKSKDTFYCDCKSNKLDGVCGHILAINQWSML